MTEYSRLRLAAAAAGALFVVLALAAYAIASFPSSAGASPEATVVPREESGPAINESLRDLHEAAIRAHIECVEASGIITAHAIEGEGFRPTRVSRRVPATEESMYEAKESAQEVFAHCAAQHRSHAQPSWGYRSAAPTDEERHAALDALQSCVDAGVFPPEPRLGDMNSYPLTPGLGGRQVAITRDQLKLYGECGLDVEAETGIPAPQPLLVDDNGDPLLDTDGNPLFSID